MENVQKLSKGSELDNIGDFLGIDDLLDFSNEEIAGPIGEASYIGFKPPSIVVGGNETSELCVPCDDLAELEWLSNFVEDPFMNIGEENLDKVEKNQFNRGSPVSVLGSSTISQKPSYFKPDMAIIRGRARSKRSRARHSIWNTHILSAIDASASNLESSSTSTITTIAPQSVDMEGFTHEQAASSFLHKKPKSSGMKVKKLLHNATETRKCLHCRIQKTPQWRAGPMGPKTLCNACGVRYKSGRLLPEYRPAASPTFVESMHSNSHKKVLEMRSHREQKEAQRVEACHVGGPIKPWKMRLLS